MQIEVNGEIKHVPSSLEQITLSKFIEWYATSGRELDDKLKEILSAEYDDDLQLEFALEDHILNEAIAWYSFHTGCDFESIKATPDGELLFNQYKVIRYLLKESESETQDFPAIFNWNNEEWQIQNFVVDPKSEMRFGEIITSKEVQRQIYSLGLSKWDSLLYLSCIFFRKKGEPFRDELIHSGSERMELLKTLPMNYALSVGFFLTSCVNIWQNDSHFSKEEAEETQSQSLQSSMKSMAG